MIAPLSACDLSQSSPTGFHAIACRRRPREYTRLMKEKLRLEQLADSTGRLGAESASARTLKPGQSGDAWWRLRNRLIAMGYPRCGRRSRPMTPTIADGGQAVPAWPTGLTPDGVAGARTIGRDQRPPLETRLKSVIVAMERERWLNQERGDAAHSGQPDRISPPRSSTTARSPSRPGRSSARTSRDRRTPEFSDVMEFMVINPSWYVPRSIVDEGIPAGAAEQPQCGQPSRDHRQPGPRGQPRRLSISPSIPRATFPSRCASRPADGNALGLVKFMFPNKYNIYLHDTPPRILFGREVRAYQPWLHPAGRSRSTLPMRCWPSRIDDPEGHFPVASEHAARKPGSIWTTRCRCI